MMKTVQKLMAIVMVLALVAGFSGNTAAAAQTGGPQRPSFNGERIDTAGADLPAAKPLSEKSGPVSVVVLLKQPGMVMQNISARSSGTDLSTEEAQSRLGSIIAQQETVQAALEAAEIGAQTIFKNQRVYNGIAIRVDSASLDAISAIPGVEKIVPLTTHVLDNANVVDKLGAKTAWQPGTFAPGGLTGEGVSIGVIDTGVDFIHTNFGGTGIYAAAATATADFTVANPAVFPTAKVVGGWDFAGDAYNADPASVDYSPNPEPDPIPMDCHGHGSHVAGSATGLGVNANGTTYTGAYNSSLDTFDLRIGPGMAPKAELYALRVFGCTGSTELTDMAFEWAVDPNGDGNTSDHLDVVNLSLGSPFGLPDDSTTLAANAAVEAGVVVVTSSGNAGDTYFVTGSPGVAEKAISVAASVDSFEMMDAFTVNAPAAIVGNYGASAAVEWPASDPDVTGDLLYPGAANPNRNGCSAFPENYFAGKIALLDWTLPMLCGSVLRSNNATTAGAIGVLMIYDDPVLGTAITGSSLVPSMITTKTVGDLIKAQITGGQTVNITMSLDDLATYADFNMAIDDTLAYFSSRGPRTGDYLIKPDVAAPGMTVFSTNTGRYWDGDAVAYGPGDTGVSMNGTSMASPVTAGAMVLLRQLRPTWTVEELKAAVMNTAFSDVYVGQGQTGQVYSPTRVGAGRINVSDAASAEVLVYKAAGNGAVSVTFGAPEVATTFTSSQTINVANKSGSSETYSLSYAAVADLPGADITLTNMAGSTITSLTVPANTVAQFQIKLTATAADLRNTVDPSLELFQGGLERVYLAEESGLVLLDQPGSDALRLPVFAAPRAVADMKVTSAFNTWANQSGTVDLTLAGTEIDNTGGTFTGFPEDEVSLAGFYELGTLSSPKAGATGVLAYADLQAVGITSDYLGYVRAGDPPAQALLDANIYFGIATYGQWDTPSQVEFDIFLDTDNDLAAEYAIYNFPYYVDGDPTDIHVSYLYDYAFPTAPSVPMFYINFDDGTYLNTRVLRNNVMMLAVPASEIGLTSTNTKINYWVRSWSAYSGIPVETTSLMTYDFVHPQLDLSAGYPGPSIFPDINGITIPAEYDRTGANASLPAPAVLVLHHHNAFAQPVEIVKQLAYFLPVLKKP